jgi:hypothetical protein
MFLHEKPKSALYFAIFCAYIVIKQEKVSYFALKIAQFRAIGIAHLKRFLI